MSVRVRFAPSPTGNVHIGNIRTAIFNWLFARHEGGKFLLRIEDTDRERYTPEALQAVLESLEWLGIDFDEDPVYQSKRLDAHLAAANKLLEAGAAYKEDKGNTGKGECIIFKMPGTDVTYTDLVKGELHKKAEDLKDFVIVRSDGSPTFHLANIVDDIEMGITHIIRGDDHVENVYKHIPLYSALGVEPPKYAHLPMIVNQHGKPYSKRDGDAYVGDFREKGFSPEALFNYLSLLGWSPGDDREKMTRQEMIEAFTLDRVKSSAALMDFRKLTNLNGQYIAELPLDEFVTAVKEVVAGNEWGGAIDDDYFRKVCELMQSRCHLLVYANDWKYFFSDDLEFEEKPVRKFLDKEGQREALAALAAKLEAIDFAELPIEKAIREAEAEADMKEGKLNQSLRVAVTGKGSGAGIYETAALLGKDRVLTRLEKI